MFMNSKHFYILYGHSKQLRLTDCCMNLKEEIFVYLCLFALLKLEICQMCLPCLLTIVIFEKATGGGAYKFADLFKERLGMSIEKEDEMNCLVAGANFLLKVQSNSAYCSPFISSIRMDGVNLN